jgi:RNA polymerase sigma-70 factor (ECF subfamily)
MSGKKDDIELVRELRNGNEKAFEELINRYSAKAFSLASRLTRNKEDAEEVLQDVFVTVYRKINSFEEKSSFSSWLYRITVNSSFMKLRKRKRSASVALEDLQPSIRESATEQARSTELYEVQGDECLLRQEVGGALEQAILRLPDDYRPVFVLRDVDGLSSKEVGKLLKLSIPAVKSRLHRSRLMVRRRLQAFYDEFSKGAQGF